MAKPRPSLESFAQAAVPTAVPPLPAQAPSSPDQEPTAVVKGLRKDRPHTTLYLDKRAIKAIKEIALQYDRKPHDLYLEGIDMMLTHYGRPSLKDLSK